MSGEILRRAASLMRERAEAEPVRTVSDPRVTGVWLHSAHYLTVTPAVALAVADWLDHAAEEADATDRLYAPHFDRQRPNALAVARAYLGESA